MPIIEIILLGIALAMDSFAVSVCMAAASDKLKLKNILTIAAFFGFFQALMPLIGWKLGSAASGYFEYYDHCISFILLFFIGFKMIHESIKCRHCETEKKVYGDPTNIYVLFTLSIATSIDALAVGVSIGCLEQEIFEPAVIIGLITFAISLIGAKLGSKIGGWAEGKIEIAGGLILIGIGLKILLEHTFFA